MFICLIIAMILPYTHAKTHYTANVKRVIYHTATILNKAVQQDPNNKF